MRRDSGDVVGPALKSCCASGVGSLDILMSGFEVDLEIVPSLVGIGS